MKTATYQLTSGQRITVPYDETAPCVICGEPVIEASMGGTDICPWCDVGKCRYCGIKIIAFKENVDGGRSLRDLREHMAWHCRERKIDEQKLVIDGTMNEQGLRNALDSLMRSSNSPPVQNKWCALNDFDQKYVLDGIVSLVKQHQHLELLEKEQGQKLQEAIRDVITLYRRDSNEIITRQVMAAIKLHFKEI